MIHNKLKLDISAYSIDEPICINTEHIPKDYDTHIILKMLDLSKIPQEDPIGKPFFSHVIITSGAIQDNEGNIIYRVLEEVKGAWDPDTYRILKSVFGEAAVKIGMAGVSLDDIISRQEGSIREIKSVMSNYEDVMTSMRALRAYGYTFGEASELIKLQALRNISDRMNNITDEIVDAYAELFLRDLRQ